MEEVALLIEFDLYTGERAGGINPKDPGLRCYGWQDLESVPAKEIRLVVDGRDVSQYEGIPGITVLKGKDAINMAIDSLNLERYDVDNNILFDLSLKALGIDLSLYLGWKTQDILKDLFNQGVAGIRKQTPRKL